MEDQALMQVLLKKKNNNNDNNKNKKICKWLGHGVGRFCEKKEKKMLRPQTITQLTSSCAAKVVWTK